MAMSHRPTPPATTSNRPDSEVGSRSSLAQLRALGYNQVPSAPPVLRGRSVSAVQAAMGSGVLTPLLRQARDAQQCLAHLKSVLPPALMSMIESGPIENGQWTLLVGHSSAAAKIRQWVPALAAHVRSKGWPVDQIVVKVRPK